MYRESVLTPDPKRSWKEKYAILLRLMKVIFFPIWCLLYITFVVGLSRLLYGYILYGNGFYLYNKIEIYREDFWAHRVKSEYKYWNIFEDISLT